MLYSDRRVPSPHNHTRPVPLGEGRLSQHPHRSSCRKRDVRAAAKEEKVEARDVRAVPIKLVSVSRGSSVGSTAAADEWIEKLKRWVGGLALLCCPATVLCYPATVLSCCCPATVLSCLGG